MIPKVLFGKLLHWIKDKFHAVSSCHFSNRKKVAVTGNQDNLVNKAAVGH